MDDFIEKMIDDYLAKGSEDDFFLTEGAALNRFIQTHKNKPDLPELWKSFIKLLQSNPNSRTAMAFEDHLQDFGLPKFSQGIGDLDRFIKRWVDTSDEKKFRAMMKETVEDINEGLTMRLADKLINQYIEENSIEEGAEEFVSLIPLAKKHDAKLFNNRIAVRQGRALIQFLDQKKAKEFLSKLPQGFKGEMKTSFSAGPSTYSVFVEKIKKG